MADIIVPIDKPYTKKNIQKILRKYGKEGIKISEDIIVYPTKMYVYFLQKQEADRSLLKDQEVIIANPQQEGSFHTQVFQKFDGPYAEKLITGIILNRDNKLKPAFSDIRVTLIFSMGTILDVKPVIGFHNITFNTMGLKEVINIHGKARLTKKDYFHLVNFVELIKFYDFDTFNHFRNYSFIPEMNVVNVEKQTSYIKNNNPLKILTCSYCKIPLSGHYYKEVARDANYCPICIHMIQYPWEVNRKKFLIGWEDKPYQWKDKKLKYTAEKLINYTNPIHNPFRLSNTFYRVQLQDGEHLYIIKMEDFLKYNESFIDKLKDFRTLETSTVVIV